MTDTDLERRLRRMLTTAGEHPIDTGRGWREFQALRSRTSRNRRLSVASVALAAVAAIAIAIPLVTGGAPAVLPRTRTTGPVGGNSKTPVLVVPPGYLGAIVARIPLTGVVDVVGAGAQVWAIRDFGPVANTSYQLVRIDLRTNRVTLRVDLGHTFTTVAAGGGAVWLNTAVGQAQGQVVRIDPVTGKVKATLHLPAGQCSYVTYIAGSLWAQCDIKGPGAADFLRINPNTGRVNWQAGPIAGQTGAVAVTPQGVWYVDDNGGISGLVGAGGRVRPVTVNYPAYPVSFFYTQSMVYSEGSVWVLTNDESVAKIDPANGRVTETFGYQNYDPTSAGGLNFLAVGQGSLWFLADGYPFSGVLRVSLATGKPLGRVPGIPSSSCGEPCSQIYVTSGAVWVADQVSLIRIDPARLPS